MTFRLDTSRGLVIEDAGSPWEIRWTIEEAKASRGRHEAQAAKFERLYDVAARAGRTIAADTALAMLSYHADMARELFTVLQGAVTVEAA